MMCYVAMQLWVCAESNYLCKHKVTLNTHPQPAVICTSHPFSVTSRLLRTFESIHNMWQKRCNYYKWEFPELFANVKTYDDFKLFLHEYSDVM